MNVFILPLMRTFTTSCRRTAKPGYFLHKLIEREKNIENKIVEQENNKLTTVKRLPPEANRRQRVLNALYMETITGVLASEFGERLSGYGITVIEVRINFELTIVNVYWICESDVCTESGTVEVAEAAATLKEIAPQIRAELTAVRHMGVIPKIQFVRYTGLDNGKDVISILKGLRAAGEVEGVQPAVPVQDNISDVYGLDRTKILQELKTKCAFADVDLAGRVNVDIDLQKTILKKLQMKRVQRKKENVLSTKERARLEREVYEEVFLKR
ncbi:uncharacterized protein LOC111260483 isoform X1 [Varroa jacobsoni]|uniref:uncharacterized protein LOC111260483 isoform X1 n=2 Tax=Varroa jacobsoni TaxID=62625 RepID=UPI000BF5D011|nr:uncharacterized protein LOC111260483 isoform X1 [Varroa jacobsoni]XP_022689028.1 uncharacterized protein LOC111260483 isoform X1 [Varroa jacobsoni]XP_022689029.1 uncharacterized protein LOC111260483 isoform X1 [Varroa jacobsoni]XP_022689030.1 uncharacterized protein LOC111260483 isoform X1 [Varroa jacobsoni]XP_022689031.1 uncharacterized protein LOC111260483 isoform X1 [Varroa jacobsoni]XP_022689032.1 uncharacterized protein LOC111260483 isoform X1 [Varroa jacobsoni]XP_022689033.1 uncharac